MSTYLLLKDAKQCPHCRCKGRVNHYSVCPNCGTMLFLRPINFEAYENDGALRTYWLFTSDRGWIHRDHVMNQNAKATERDYSGEKVPEGYGTHTTPEEVAAKTGKSRRVVSK